MVGGLALLMGACATAAPEPTPTPGAARPPARPGPRPAAYESEDFVVTFAQPGDTPETLAARVQERERRLVVGVLGEIAQGKLPLDGLARRAG